MILIDREIRFLLLRKDLVLEPLDAGQIQPASVDLRLDRFARRIKSEENGELDLRDPGIHKHFEEIELSDSGYLLPPLGSIIAQTAEFMRLPETCMGRIADRSSLLRVGLRVSASLINPGYAGKLPCLIYNTTPRPLRIPPGLPFCQLVLHSCLGRPERTYPEKGDAKYHGEQPFRQSGIAADVQRWVKPAPRPVNPQEVSKLKVELVADGEGEDGKP